MNPPGGAATQICARQFDRRFFNLSQDLQAKIQRRIDELGENLHGFPHYRMQGVDAFRLRVGDYRIIYQFNVEKNELHLIAVGNRREIYNRPIN
jgi:mRNA interferase RelE/StbE